MMATITRLGRFMLMRTCGVADCGDAAWFDVTDERGDTQSSCWRFTHSETLRHEAVAA